MGGHRRRAVEAEIIVASAIFGNLMAQPKRGFYTPVLPPYNCATQFVIIYEYMEVLGWQGNDIPMKMY